MQKDKDIYRKTTINTRKQKASIDPSKVADFDGSRDDLTSQCSEEDDGKSKKSG